jgi:thiol:disulfide interchange protein DsbD
MLRIGWLMALLLALAGASFAARPALAAESSPVATARSTATLVSDTDAVAAGQPFRVALRLRMATGWHTYWRNPGDAGVPPDLAFTLPAGMTAGPIAWPTPSRQPEGDLMTYGYSGDLLLPVKVSGAGAAGATVKLHASWLVCSQICVPEQGDFTLDLPAGAPTPSAQAPLFAAADARIPRPSPWPARLSPDGTLSVATAGVTPEAVKEAWFIPATPDAIAANAPQKLTVGEGTLSLHLQPAASHATTLDGVLVIADRSGQTSAYDISAPDGPSLVEPAAPTPLLVAFGFALLGGFILNLMPCVFPVLAMKAVGLARLSGAERSHARMHAVAYGAGVVVMFSALGGALLALRAAGSLAGWGFQFQSPVFVGLMALLLFGVGLNLSGVFAVTGSGAGHSLSSRGGVAGSFFAGLLAVLVATPCTAPFMAPAIATALAASPAVTVAIFAAMGLGLAAPYMLLAGIPGLTRALPRPGPWMEVLRQALAFPMYGAAVWLAWVMSQEAGPSGVLALGVGLLLLGFAAWLLGLMQTSGSGTRMRIGLAVSSVAVVAAVILVGGLAQTATPVAAAAAESGTEPFSAARLAALRDAGRPVFVNMTAAWCVTCLVNERVALSPPAVRAAFASHNVAYLKGDWTRENPEITAFLRAHARDGVPLYVMFPAGHGPEEVLPQILTEGAVLSAIAPGA